MMLLFLILSAFSVSPGISLEGMMLKLKLQYFGHLMWRVDSLEKTDAGRDWGQEKKGTAKDEMPGWHHQLIGHEFGWTLGVGDGQEGLACCNSWGRKESDTTEQLNWTECIFSQEKAYTFSSCLKILLQERNKMVTVQSAFQTCFEGNNCSKKET